MSSLFPVMLNLDSRTAVIFGGGKVARRRAAKLLKAGARVRVVSREFERGLMGLEGEIEFIEAEVKGNNIRDYLDGAFLVVAATDDVGLNSEIEGEARREGILVNRADAVSDIIFPAVIEEGGVIISISTSGKSPAVTKALKKRIKRILTPEDLAQLELQEYLRETLRKKDLSQKQRESILRDVMNMPEILDYLKKGEVSRTREALRRIVDAHH
jgi:precorrin-2 dehydrogenase/sirohydrochlorin ferrochelatase